jgi:hypothetical protein
MHASLAHLHAGYARLLQKQTPQALEIHPGNDSSRWNARQIVEHLVLTYRSSSAVFRERLAKGRPTQSDPGAYQNVQQFFVCRFGFFPAGRQAPAGVIPAASSSELLDGGELAVKMQSALQSMDEILVVCEERFGGRRFATHLVLGPLSAEQWRKFHVVHGTHHLKQLRSLGLLSSAKEAHVPGKH